MQILTSICGNSVVRRRCCCSSPISMEELKLAVSTHFFFDIIDHNIFSVIFSDRTHTKQKPNFKIEIEWTCSTDSWRYHHQNGRTRSLPWDTNDTSEIQRCKYWWRQHAFVSTSGVHILSWLYDILQKEKKGGKAKRSVDKAVRGDFVSLLRIAGRLPPLSVARGRVSGSTTRTDTLLQSQYVYSILWSKFRKDSFRNGSVLSWSVRSIAIRARRVLKDP